LEPQDGQLVADFRAGDRRAGDELARRHLSRVRNLAFQLVLDPHLADDVTQEAFSRAWAGLAQFRGDAEFQTWLHRIVLNVAYRALRNPKRARTQRLPEEAVAPPDTDTLVEGERRDRIAVALGNLAPSLRAALVLTVLQGYSAIEAAQLEGCSLGTFYWRVHEARRRLKLQLKDLIE